MARLKAFNPQEKLTLARNLFWRKGYHATSMEEMVQATGLSRASIYETYGDKQELFRLSLLNYLDFVAADNLQAIAGIESPLAALEKLLESVIKRTHQSGNACMGVKSALEIGKTDKQINELLLESIEKTIQVFAGLIERAKLSGEVDASKDAQGIARIIMYFVSGMAQNFSVAQNISELKQACKTLIEVIK